MRNKSALYPTVKYNINNKFYTYQVRLLTVILTGSTYILSTIKCIDYLQSFIAYSILLTAYLYLEVKNLIFLDKKLFFIKPPILASIFTFALPCGITNFIFLLPDDDIYSVGIEPTITPWMNILMLMVIMAAISMWSGYSSSVGYNIGCFLQKNKLVNKLIIRSYTINKPVIIILIFITFLAKLISIKLGIFGYSANYDDVIMAANYTQYFSIADSLSKLILFVLALSYYSSHNKKLLFLLQAFITYQIIFGFLSGMKSGVIAPFFTVGIAYYIINNKFPKWMFTSIIAGIFIAYAVIEPFREARNLNNDFDGTSLTSIFSTMTTNQGIDSNSDGEANTSLKFLSRSNIIYDASQGIEYSANNTISSDRPHFMENIIFSPANAFLPRFIWNNKPLDNLGLWYTNEVMGRTNFSSTAMSPFTYLNFAGGPIMVIIGFFGVGVIQRAIVDGFSHFGGGGVIIFLGMLTFVMTVDNNFGTFMTNIFRFPLLLIIAQRILLKKTN